MSQTDVGLDQLRGEFPPGDIDTLAQVILLNGETIEEISGLWDKLSDPGVACAFRLGD